MNNRPNWKTVDFFKEMNPVMLHLYLCDAKSDIAALRAENEYLSKMLEAAFNNGKIYSSQIVVTHTEGEPFTTITSTDKDGILINIPHITVMNDFYRPPFPFKPRRG